MDNAVKASERAEKVKDWTMHHARTSTKDMQAAVDDAVEASDAVRKCREAAEQRVDALSSEMKRARSVLADNEKALMMSGMEVDDAARGLITIVIFTALLHFPSSHISVVDLIAIRTYCRPHNGST